MVGRVAAEGDPGLRDREGEKEYVLEEAIVADFGLVRAWKGDRHGNLVYRESARNFNPLAAMCGRVTIAEVEDLSSPASSSPTTSTRRASSCSAWSADPRAAADKRIEKRTDRADGRRSMAGRVRRWPRGRPRS